MNLSTATTPQGRQNEVVAAYIKGAMSRTEFPVAECSGCGINLYPSDKPHQHYPEDYCDACVPKCALENDCGQPMHPGAEGGCKMHEIAAWLDALREEDDPNTRIDIVTRLIGLGYVAQ